MKTSYPSIFVLFLFSFFSYSGITQEFKEFKSKKLQKDFKQFVAFLETHPDPYQHCDEKRFKAVIDSISNTLENPKNLLEFYKDLALTTALIKDGHSAIWLPRKWMKNKRKEFGAFPYHIHMDENDDFFVIKNFGRKQIPVGAKILSIQGMGMDEFVKQIDPLISYELKHFRNTIIDNAFEFYLYLVFEKSNGLEFQYKHATTEYVTIKNMDYNEWKEKVKDEDEEREKRIDMGKPYTYESIGKGVGLLTLYSFSTRSLDSYDLFLDKTFKQIKHDKIHSLIIDVRGNYGGWPKIASRLFHFISDNYFKTMAISEAKVSFPYQDYFYRKNPELRSNIHITATKRRHFIDIMGVLKSPIGTVLKEEAFFNEGPQTMGNEFTGDCYLLINRDSYSAASSFASTFQCYQMGTIIGSETGGTKIFRANPISEELINTGFKVRISTTKLYTACYNEEFEGVHPDIEYNPSVLELCSDLDTQLFFTKNIISKVQKKKKANK